MTSRLRGPASSPARCKECVGSAAATEPYDGDCLKTPRRPAGTSRPLWSPVGPSICGSTNASRYPIKRLKRARSRFIRGPSRPRSRTGFIANEWLLEPGRNQIFVVVKSAPFSGLDETDLLALGVRLQNPGDLLHRPERGLRAI